MRDAPLGGWFLFNTGVDSRAGQLQTGPGNKAGCRQHAMDARESDQQKPGLPGPRNFNDNLSRGMPRSGVDYGSGVYDAPRFPDPLDGFTTVSQKRKCRSFGDINDLGRSLALQAGS